MMTTNISVIHAHNLWFMFRTVYNRTNQGEKIIPNCFDIESLKESGIFGFLSLKAKLLTESD